MVYDDWNRAGSARAWWVLTAAGIKNVRILDGGLAAWRSAGGGLKTGPVSPQPGNVTVPHSDLYAGSRPTLTAQQCGAGDLTLLDARAPERFRGNVESIDAVAGHIPGARNVPSGNVLASDGTFLDDNALRQLVSDRGIDHGQRVGRLLRLGCHRDDHHRRAGRGRLPGSAVPRVVVRVELGSEPCRCPRSRVARPRSTPAPTHRTQTAANNPLPLVLPLHRHQYLLLRDVSRRRDEPPDNRVGDTATVPTSAQRQSAGIAAISSLLTAGAQLRCAAALRRWCARWRGYRPPRVRRVRGRSRRRRARCRGSPRSR